jgi:hypothetical protein
MSSACIRRLKALDLIDSQRRQGSRSVLLHSVEEVTQDRHPGSHGSVNSYVRRYLPKQTPLQQPNRYRPQPPLVVHSFLCCERSVFEDTLPTIDLSNALFPFFSCTMFISEKDNSFFEQNPGGKQMIFKNRRNECEIIHQLLLLS